MAAQMAEADEAVAHQATGPAADRRDRLPGRRDRPGAASGALGLSPSRQLDLEVWDRYCRRRGRAVANAHSASRKASQARSCVWSAAAWPAASSASRPRSRGSLSVQRRVCLSIGAGPRIRSWPLRRLGPRSRPPTHHRPQPSIAKPRAHTRTLGHSGRSTMSRWRSVAVVGVRVGHGLVELDAEIRCRRAGSPSHPPSGSAS